MMSSLASLVVRRRRAVITIWILLLVGAGVVGSSAFSVLSSSFGAGPSTESGRVTERLDDLAELLLIIAIVRRRSTRDRLVTHHYRRAARSQRSTAFAFRGPWSYPPLPCAPIDGPCPPRVFRSPGGLDEEESGVSAHQISAVAPTSTPPSARCGKSRLEQFGTASEKIPPRRSHRLRSRSSPDLLLCGLRAAGMPMLVGSRCRHLRAARRSDAVR